MISYTRDFLFIHIYKVAGTSIRAALMPHTTTLSQRAIRKCARYIGQRWYDIYPLGDHPTALQYNKLLGERYQKMFKFAFVRNPYDWQVSLYHFMQQNRNHPQHDKISRMDFGKYVEWRCSEDLRLQKNFVCGPDGKMLVDFVGRYEQLQPDFSVVCRKLGITSSLPWRNQSSHRPFAAYYDDKTAAKIASAFKEDFSFFGYSTDLPAMRLSEVG